MGVWDEDSFAFIMMIGPRRRRRGKKGEEEASPFFWRRGKGK